MNLRADRLKVVVTLFLLIAGPAHAYIGPGAGLTVIGTVLALIGAVLLGIVGFVWYPIKRLRASMAKNKNSAPEQEEVTEADVETKSKTSTDADADDSA